MTTGPIFVAAMERVLQLRLLPGMDRLPPVYLGAVARRAKERFFRQGALLLDPLHPVGAAYLVLEGRVATNKRDGSAVEIGAGGAVGFLELLGQLDSGVEARAVKDTVTLELDWDTHLSLCDDYFPILHNYLQLIAGQLLSNPTRLCRIFGESGSRAPVQHDSGKLDLVARVLALVADQAFSNTSLDAVVELARHAVHVVHGTGDVIWNLGDDAGSFLLLVSGSVRCESPACGVWQLEPTQSLGLHEAIAGSPRWFEATATHPVAGLEIRAAQLLDILDDHLELGTRLLSNFARQLLNVPPQVGWQSQQGTL